MTHGGGAIELVLSDVDGTLLTSDKSLTPATVDAVRALHAAGIRFTVTSSRPPQGMAMLVDPLGIDAPMGAFNGGVFVDEKLRVVDEHALALDVVATLVEMIDDAGLSPWVYTGRAWYVRDAHGPHVEHESGVVHFVPTVAADLVAAVADGPDEPVKVLGFSDDHPRVLAAEAGVRAAFGDAVSATRSQPHYLDVTHPDANKGAALAYLAATLGIPTTAIATIGDGQNDTLMFVGAGTSIAMGNASDEVKSVAGTVTSANDDDGFAAAMHDFVLDS